MGEAGAGEAAPPEGLFQWDLSREHRVLGALPGRRELLLLEGENARQGLLGES